MCCLATSTNFLNPFGSLTAISAEIFLSTLMPDFVRPLINLEYVTPC